MYDLTKVKFFMQCSANTLHHNWPLMQAFNIRLEELSKGHGLTVCVTFLKKKGDESTWALDEDCYLDEGKYYEQNSTELEKLFYAWLVARKNFYDVVEQIDAKIAGLTDSDGEISLAALLELYKKFNYAYVEEYATALISDYFVVYGDNIIKEISDKLTKEQQKNITALTSPLKLPFLGEEQLNELKIGLRLIENKEIKKAPKNYAKLPADIKEAIHSHQKEFFWIRNNYKYTQPISCDQFFEDIKHEIANLSPLEITKKISELQNYE